MKKLVNPLNGKEDYFCNYKDAADHLQMTVGQLKYRYTDDCTLHEDFVPKRSVLNNRFGFWLSDLDQYKNTHSHLIPKKKQKVAEKKETAEVLDFKRS